MIKIITRNELQSKIRSGDDFILIDTLPPDSYSKGHLPGAISIPSDNIIEEAPHKIPNLNTTIVVYCGNAPCKRSDKAAKRLIDLGYKTVFDYHEGKADWIAAGLPLDSLEPPHTAQP